MAYRAQAILRGRYTPTPLIVPSQRFRFYAVEQSPFNVRKSEKFMDKGGAGLVICRIIGWRIQKSIVDGTNEESDFDEPCHSKRSEESAGTYEQAAAGPSEDSCSIEIPRFARNDNLFIFINLLSILTTRRQRSKI
jgi:hypothetical protein